MAIITLPGLIDIHVHLRDPHQTHKEDFYTGTSAALAGGFTTIIDMPNNVVPITTKKLLDEKITEAGKKIVCDVGFHFGSLGDNVSEFKKTSRHIFGIKLYLNQTTGGFIIDEKKLAAIYSNWNSSQPILLHAEEDVMPMVSKVIKKTGKRTHICHVSSRDELMQIIKAKENGLPITCGVTPHHLFLSKKDVAKLGAKAHMKPFLKSPQDVEFLWKNLNYIDVIESDHAPHTLEEKENPSVPIKSGSAGGPPFGVPGLETTLPLLLQAESEGRLHFNQIIALCFTNPARIFNIPTDRNTTVEVEDRAFTIKNQEILSKCGWSPFDGWRVRGKVKRVTIRGRLVYSSGTVLVKPGWGRVLQPL